MLVSIRKQLKSLDSSVGSKLVLALSLVFVCGGLYGLITEVGLQSGVPIILLYLLSFIPLYRIIE